MASPNGPSNKPDLRVPDHLRVFLHEETIAGHFASATLAPGREW